MAWYLTDQVNSGQVLKKLATLELCSVKTWMTVGKPRTSEVDKLLNRSMEESQVSPMITIRCSLSYCPCY